MANPMKTTPIQNPLFAVSEIMAYDEGHEASDVANDPVKAMDQLAAHSPFRHHMLARNADKY
jgi:hypothetical protein